jgi:FkbM family methyltransferase
MIYKFYGQSEQDNFIFDRYFQNKRNGISIECGAFDGIMESSTLFFEESLNWSCINIEASPPIFELLNSNRKKSFNFNLGLGDKETTLSFKHAIHPYHGIKFGNGSFNHKPEHEQLLNHEGCQFEEYNITSTRYDNIIDKLMNEQFPNKIIDLFVLDVEGYEMEVLEGMKNSKFLPQILCVEYPHVGLDQIKLFLENLNYKFDLIKDNNAYFIKL